MMVANALRYKREKDAQRKNAQSKPLFENQNWREKYKKSYVKRDTPKPEDVKEKERLKTDDIEAAETLDDHADPSTIETEVKPSMSSFNFGSVEIISILFGFIGLLILIIGLINNSIICISIGPLVIIVSIIVFVVKKCFFRSDGKVGQKDGSQEVGSQEVKDDLIDKTDPENIAIPEMEPIESPAQVVAP